MPDGNTLTTMLANLLKLGPIGQLLSGIGVIAGAFIAAIAAFNITRRQAEDAWIDRFRVLYAEFWLNPDIAVVREWIINENAYKELEAVLILRNSNILCEVPHADHEKLDKIDRFCAIIARIQSFDERRIPRHQRALWTKQLNGAFWVAKIRLRAELAKYVKNHWQEILK